eukprot:jgi/Mesvir1/15575/Mv03197-RA.1
MKARLEDMFTKGLTMAAKNTDAWIVTGGADAGIMSYVGKAFRHVQSSGNSVPIIGIAAFRKVLNFRHLKVHGKQILYSRERNMNNQHFTAIEPNHTHFIFVDAPPPNGEDYDGNNGWGEEIPLRAAFEAKVIETFEVPSVLILVEGGANSIRTVWQALRSNETAQAVTKRKVVVIEKSGRSADVIPLWKRINDAKEAGKEAATKDALTSDEDSLLKMFEGMEKELDEITGKYWSQVSVFNLHERDNFEDFLYGVILEGVTDFKSKVELTTEWRSARMLKEVIKDHLNKNTVDLSSLAEDVSPAVQKALLLNDHQSFSILMDYGTIELVDLRELYMASFKEGSLWRFVDKYMAADRNMAEPILPDAGNIRHTDAGNNKAIEAILKLLHKKLPDMFNRQCDHQGYPASAPGQAATTSSPRNVDVASNENLSLPSKGHTDAIDIILWALLNRHMDLALGIWRRSDMPIHCALYASKICQVLAEKLKEEPVIQKEYLKVAESFEDFAVKVLDVYSSDDQAIQALEHPWARLKKPEEKTTSHRPQNIHATAMSLAVNATAKKFISSQHYQTSLQRKWIAYEEQNTKVHHQPQEEQNTKVRYQLPDDITHWQLLWWTLVYFFYPARWMVKVTDPSQPPGSLQRFGTSDQHDDLGVTKSGRDSGWKGWAPDYRLVSPFYHIPIVKFCTDTLLWMFFLIYLVAIAFTARTTHIAGYEIVFYFWLGILFLNEGWQTYRRGWKKVHGSTKKLHKIHHLFPDFWSKLDVINYLTFTLWMALRIACSFFDSDHLRRIAHEVLLPAIAMSFVRILNVFSVFPKFGPLLITVGKMVTDIIRFLCLMLVFLLAFAVIFAVITREWIHQTNTGELPLEEEDLTCCDQSSMERAHGDEWSKAYPYGTSTLAYWSIMGEFGESFRYMQGTKLGCAMLGIYVLIAQILLVNLLIAMMSDTYGEVRDNADCEWKMARFNVIMEFIDSPEIPPPFALLHTVKAWSWLRFRCKGRADKDVVASPLSQTGTLGPCHVSDPVAGGVQQAVQEHNNSFSRLASNVSNASGVATGMPSYMLKRTGNIPQQFPHQGGDYSGDTDICAIMRKHKQTMLEQQDIDELRSVVSKLSSVEQDLKSLHAQQQKDHEEVEKRINLLERSMLDELKKAQRQPAVMSDAKLEVMERLIKKIEEMLTK